MKHSTLFLPTFAIAAGLCVGGSSAQQSAGQQDPAPRAEQAGDPVPGDLPGTERWILHLAKRPFTLLAFRDAVRARDAAAVDAAVAELEQRTREFQQPLTTAVEDLGGAVVQQWWIVNGLAVDVTPAALVAVAKHPLVVRLERDRVQVPVLGAETSSSNHNSDEVQRVLGIDGSGVTVAIVDTGHDEDTDGLGRPHRTYYPGGDPNNTSGAGIGGSRLLINRRIGRSSADDVHGHGTGVASISAGADWGTPAADDGHAPGANIAGYAIANRSNGNSSGSVMTTAFQTMAADRVQYGIVASNLSYSGSPDPNNAQQIAMDNCALLADIMTVVAGGNNSSSTSSSQGAANGLAVAAITVTQHQVASFSSRGPLSGSNGRFYPDLAGCGVDTRMAAKDNESGDWVASGTSMAAPQCAGAATLMRAANPSMSALETKALLLSTTDDIARQNRSAPYDDRNAFGLGIVRDDRAVRAALGGSFGTENTSSTWSRVVRVEAGKAYSAVATWFRDPSLNSSWSDLSLTVLDAQGQVVASSDTPQNLYEEVRFDSDETADYVFRVDVQSLQPGMSTQEFAWAFSEVRPGYVFGELESFGVGCPAGGPVLSGNGTPELSTIYSLSVRGAAPNSNSTLVVSYNRDDHYGIALPLDLTPFGAAGCSLYVSPDLLRPLPIASSGSAFVLIPVPNNPAFVGGELFYQLLWDDPNNGLGLSFSNGVRAFFGGQR